MAKDKNNGSDWSTSFLVLVMGFNLAIGVYGIYFEFSCLNKKAEFTLPTEPTEPQNWTEVYVNKQQETVNCWMRMKVTTISPGYFYADAAGNDSVIIGVGGMLCNVMIGSFNEAPLMADLDFENTLALLNYPMVMSTFVMACLLLILLILLVVGIFCLGLAVMCKYWKASA